MKKAIKGLLVLFASLALPACATSEPKEKEEPWIWENVAPVDLGEDFVTVEADFVFSEKEDGTFEVAAKEGFAKTVIRIPSSHEGKAVTSIAESGFAGLGEVISLHIPGSVASIGERAFFDTPVRNAILGSGVTSIEDFAFGGNVARKDPDNPGELIVEEKQWSGSTYFYFPASLARVPTELDAKGNIYFESPFDECLFGVYPPAFAWTSSHQNPYGYYGCSIDDWGFVYTHLNDGYRVIAYLGAAEELTLPSVFDGKKVYQGDFYQSLGNPHMKKITLPRTMKHFSNSYLYAPDLEQFIVPDTIVSFSPGYFVRNRLQTTDVGGGKFLGSEENPYAVFLEMPFEETISDSYTFPNGCRVISDASGSYVRAKRIVLPNSLRTIGRQAFLFSPVEEVVFPKGKNLFVIGERAFMGCDNLKNIHIPHVEYVGRQAFDSIGHDKETNERRIASFRIDSGLKRLEYYGVGGTYRPVCGKVSLPKGVEFIDESWLDIFATSSSLVKRGENSYLRASDGSLLALVDYEGGPIAPCPFMRFDYFIPHTAVIDIPEGTLSVSFCSIEGPQRVTLADTVRHFAPNMEIVRGNPIVPSHSNPKFAYYVNHDGVVPDGVEITAALAPDSFDGIQGEISLPSSLRYIGAKSFCKYENQTPIVVPASVEYIESYGFYQVDAAIRLEREQAEYGKHWCSSEPSVFQN